MAKKILLADDSITIQKVVELTFSDGDYEVVAVNNGAKAIQKLSEMRPDIILSDIIMPEKNGYEVCEFVKSRPEFRAIPVILLTGTFEPFDPDRADKAGCDAVVTKPFESQSLIHKVDELIQQSQASAPPAAPAPAEPAAEPWAEQPPAAAANESPFAPPAAAEPFGGGFQQHGSDIFGAAQPPQAAAAEMPFETAPPEAFSGETRAFQRMSFEDLSGAQPAAPPPPPTAPEPIAQEPSPWDAVLPPAAPKPAPFPSMNEAPPAAPESSPWDEPPAFSGETRTFQKMSFEDLQRSAAAEPPAPSAPAPPSDTPSPWDEQPAAGGEMRAFPSMSVEEIQPPQAAATTSPAPPTAPEPAAAEPSPWDEQPAFGGETRTFPRMSFDDLQQMAAATPLPEETAPARADSSLWDEPAPAAPSWSPDAQPTSESETPATAESFPSTTSPFAEPSQEEESPFHTEPPSPAPQAPEPELTSIAGSAAPAATSSGAADLTDEQIDRIARRVVQLISNDVVKNIAWEVVPDIAEMIVKERIRQLEAEA
jgi:CheY-like chemotaxis protein